MTVVFQKAIARLWEWRNSKDVSELGRIDSIAPILECNRRSLKRVGRWIEDGVYNSAVFGYGIPDRIKHLIDKEVGDDITCSDLLLYFSQLLEENLSYLELGVSVGKNFWQVLNFHTHSNLTGFDIELINPVLQGFLTKVGSVEWETMGGSAKKGISSLTAYRYEANQNTVSYLSGDILDENSWKRLWGQKFNLVFSDALHDPEALLFEWKMIEKYRLLNDNEFVIAWDDLGGLMTISFIRIFAEIRKRYRLQRRNGFLTHCRGWLGVNEPEHAIGIIVNVPHSYC
jgi:hypothetical protein